MTRLNTMIRHRGAPAPKADAPARQSDKPRPRDVSKLYSTRIWL